MEVKKCRRRVLMFPWLAYGHISPSLELAKKLSQHSFHIYLCSSPVNLQSIQKRLPEKFSAYIEFVELHLPSLPELPPHMHTTNGLPSHLLPVLFKAFDMAAPHFSTILQKINPHLLISDIFHSWAIKLAYSLNIPATTLLATGTASLSSIVHHIHNHNSDFPFPEIHLHDHWTSRIQNLPKNSKGGYPRMVQWLQNQDFCSNILLVNSLTEIEGKYIDHLSILLKKKVIPVGPLVEEVVSTDEKSDIIDWLGKKDPKSTVYVSFGSEYYLSKEDMEELAYGLEVSGVNFIWVIRFPKGERILMEDALPNGFIGRIGERGMVVDGWAPQMKILAHSNIGGFVSHCGWNSVLEALVFGVPIVGLPMHFDHPTHAKVVAAAGVGVEAERDNGYSIQREGVANAIREVVFEERGAALRRNVRQISQILESKQVQNIRGLVAELDKLCEARKVG